MKITDSQVHIWEAPTPERPWPPFDFVPDWSSIPLTATNLISMMDEAGVSHAFLIPPAFDGGRNDYSLAAAESHPDRFAVIGRLPVDSTSGREQMEAWAAEKRGVGLRFAFFLPQQRSQFAQGQTDWIWPLAQQLQIPLMIYPATDLMSSIGEIASRYDGLQITIDHLGVGHTAKDRDDHGFRHLEQLLALAPLPNVAVKASALPDYSSSRYPWRNIHSHIGRTIDAFGPDRVFWGSDISRLRCTYSESVTMFSEEMGLSTADLELIMGGALRKWHRWDPAV